MKRPRSSIAILSVVLMVALSFTCVGSARAAATAAGGPQDHTLILQGVVQSGGTYDIQGLGGAQVALLEATEGPQS